MNADREIRRRIAARGRITFAEFMEVALYHQDGGYYASGERVGASGDYYTSPAVHPAFGTLLAVQLFQSWELLGRPAPFTVVEAGAGNGLLCRDIINAATGLHTPFREALRYVCIDRRASPGLEAGLDNASRVCSVGVPLRGIAGCVFSNELLDAMPVHQVTWQEGDLKEMYVVSQNDELAMQAGTPSTPRLARRLSSLGVRLEEGQIAEINLAIDDWTEGVAASLDRGFVLTIDYGRLAEDLYSPMERFRGTLTTYRKHLQTDRPLERVGQQDMTAQVDFTALARAAKDAGLDVLGYADQAGFLQNLGIGSMQRRPDGQPGRHHSNGVALRELVKPEGLGAFRVMAFGKNVGSPQLWGFHSSEEPADLVDRMSVPVPTSEHIDLLAGRYPWHQAESEVPWDTLWPVDETAE